MTERSDDRAGQLDETCNTKDVSTTGRKKRTNSGVGSRRGLHSVQYYGRVSAQVVCAANE